MKMKKIAIIGSGTMGHGIAQISALAGFKVSLRDVKEEFVHNGLRRIRRSLKRSIDRGKMTQNQADDVIALIKGTTDLAEAVKDADVVIEAISEDLKSKKMLFKELDELCSEHTILASNTSTLSITEMASVTRRSDRFIGMHFFNPVQVMKLVEIIRGSSTSDKTFREVENLSKKLGKTPVEVIDSPGFIVNRCLAMFINESIFILMEGAASKEDIDLSMRFGLNHPMGPLQLADYIGLDILLSILEILYNEFADPKYRPCPLLKRMVRAGFLGRKTNKGFYEYK